MPKTIVITQSNYVPWRGYFSLLARADEVVLLDSVQYTRRDWRNRNRIKTPNGLAWLTIAVETKGGYQQSIDETRIAAPNWASEHIRSIEFAYRRSPHFATVAPWLFEAMQSVAAEPMLSVINEQLLLALCQRLGITTSVTRCTDIIDRVQLGHMDATQRLVAIAEARGATCYLSGPAAKDYLEVSRFSDRGIQVAWMDYAGYPEYPQLWGAYEPAVSIIDLLLNVGDDAPSYLVRATQ